MSKPNTPASTSTSTTADEIKKYKTAKLIEFLQCQEDLEDLGLSETALGILENSKIWD